MGRADRAVAACADPTDSQGKLTMNQSKYDSKLDPKQDPGKATVAAPSSSKPSLNKSPDAAHVDNKGDEAKPAIKAAADAHGTTNGAASGDKADSESMVNEGGRSAVGEPDAETHAKTDSTKGSVEGVNDGAASKLSATPAS
jgi:hypothetical protein